MRGDIISVKETADWKDAEIYKGILIRITYDEHEHSFVRGDVLPQHRKAVKQRGPAYNVKGVFIPREFINWAPRRAIMEVE